MFRNEKRAFLAIERLGDSLAAQLIRIETLERANKKLELEWVETYDKIRHQLSRMARRGDLSNGKGGDEIVDETTNAEPEMDAISARIHARRNRSYLKEV